MNCSFSNIYLRLILMKRLDHQLFFFCNYVIVAMPFSKTSQISISSTAAPSFTSQHVYLCPSGWMGKSGSHSDHKSNAATVFTVRDGV